MSPPSKEFEKLIYQTELIHDGNPVTRWMLGNVELSTDPAGNIKPDKAKSTEKIDGIVATIMAFGLIMVKQMQIAEEGASRYDSEEGGGLWAI